MTVGLYVHFPYCARRCSYCDFNTYVVESIPAARYTGAILAQGAARAPAFQPWRLRTVYFGGGTPSLWGPDGIRQVVEALPHWFAKRAPELEITLECNPAEATAERLEGYRAVGVNRLSLGVQSLDDTILVSLLRRHDSRSALEALRTALRVGFDTVSADLMFGLPGQDLARWCHDLRTVAETGVSHISVYHLTLEPGTAMTRDVRQRRVLLPDDDLAADMWDAIDPTLAPFGLARYEVSNFARPGHESRHNLNYWSGRPYLGLGAGAHSFLPPADWRAPGAAAIRSANRRHHASFLDEVDAGGGHATDFREEIDRATHLRERMFTGLRCLRGLSLGAVERDLGVSPRGVFAEALAALVDEGLISDDGDLVKLTKRGLRLADEVFVRFF